LIEEDSVSVGYPKGKAELDERSGTISVSVRNIFREVDSFQMFLQATPDADLTSPPYNYTPQEVAVLKSAYNDLAKLSAIYLGAATQPDAYDFRTFSKLLTGVL
jgi:hypothetical protein